MSMILLAARSEANPAVGAIMAVVFLVVVVALVLRESTAQYHIVRKGSLPYCPRCNRQISMKRDHCRACGYRFKTYGDSQQSARTAANHTAGRLEAESTKEAEERLRLGELAAKERAEKRIALAAARRAERRAERDMRYRAKGVEPGPWAWFKVLPDVVQAIMLGLAFAIPTVAVLVALWSALAPSAP